MHVQSFTKMDETEEMEPANPSFIALGLDDRILKAIAKLGWTKPTEVQRRTIPLALDGKDVIAQAKTGSGKTAAYIIPLIQIILKQGCSKGFTALAILPSKELCKQAYKNILELTAYCTKQVRAADIGHLNANTMRPLLARNPHILVTTPSKLLVALNHGMLDLKASMEILVIDEADVLFSYGYENDVKTLISSFPKIHQCILLSATISQDIEQLKSMLLRNPVLVKIREVDDSASGKLSHFIIKVEPSDKYLILHSLLKLKLLRGKILIFVNSINTCYRVKLFLEQFAIKSCVINSELPQNSRVHIVEEFNKGLYDIIIATDEAVLQSTSSSKASKKKVDQEYSVSRGMDFQDVESVLNFDFPSTSEQYIHRVGRTARGDNTGVALSIVTYSDSDMVQAVDAKLSGVANAKEAVLRPYLFKMDEIEGFRYRVKDAFKAVTKVAIREARLKEIKVQLLNSEHLKSHFEDNPKDLQVLRHDKVLRPAAVKPHLKNIPDYLVPETLKPVLLKGKWKKKLHRGAIKGGSGREKFKGKCKIANDPLKTFSRGKQKGKVKKK